MSATFLDGLSETARDDLRARGTVRRHERSSVLLEQGAPGDSVLVLLSGTAKLVALRRDTTLLVAVRGPGDLLGEMAVLDGGPRAASAIALEPGEGLVVAAGDFRDHLRRHPDTALLVSAVLAARLREADSRAGQHAVGACASRLAARLLDLAERFGRAYEDGIHVDVPVTQAELATWVGCSRESAARSLRSMRDAGWIRTARGGIVVCDRDALASLAA